MQFNTPQYKYNDQPYFIVCSFTEKSIGLKGVKEMGFSCCWSIVQGISAPVLRADLAIF